MTAIRTDGAIIFSGPMVRALIDGRKTMTRRAMKPQPTPSKSKPGHHWWPSNAARMLIDVEGFLCDPGDPTVAPSFCPYGTVEDELWVREAFALVQLDCYPGTSYAHVTACWKGPLPESLPPGWFVLYRAGDFNEKPPVRWRSPLFMPRWASRITLEITGVRVERVQEISEADAAAEGFEVQLGDGTGPSWGFKWNGPGYWDGFSRGRDREKTYHAPAASGPCCCYVGEREFLTPAKCAFRHAWDSLNGKKSGHDWDSNPWVWVVSFKRAMP